jgi:hypothetical protein
VKKEKTGGKRGKRNILQSFLRSEKGGTLRTSLRRPRLLSSLLNSILAAVYSPKLNL